MKKLLIITAIMLATSAAHAQDGASVSAQQIEQMIEDSKKYGGGRVKINTTTIMAAMGMHSCMQEKIGDAGIKRLGEWGTALGKEVKPLCAAGARDEALAAQMRYAKSVMKTKEYAGVRACADQYKDLLADPMFTDIRAVVENPAQTDKHICDYQNKASAYSAQTK
ncbi:MAG: hypothetical protein J0M34_01320 [Alphaproteobacteria bacterium]|nr:hypothetical protein [Alphaproteobacteria bacterium]